MAASELDQYIATSFTSKGVRFYHAENLRNFFTYCSAGALLSRAELMRRDPNGYTRFYSDPLDLELGALDRVFGNIYDFGSIFSRASNAIPNVYGPITLIFKPEVFESVTDIALTPHSIATHRREWQAQRVSDKKTVDEIVAGDAFGHPIASKWTMCELSCAESMLPLDLLERIYVEPITIGEKPLIDLVRMAGRHLRVPITTRHYKKRANIDLLQGLVSICARLPETLDDSSWPVTDEHLSAWSHVPPAKRNRLSGWCKYFYFGTLTECRRVEIEEQLDEDDDRTVCELCDPKTDGPPALVSYASANPGNAGPGALDIGICSYCTGISVRCRKCDTVNPLYEWQYDQIVSCDGGCSIRFRVVSDQSHDGSDPYVEMIDYHSDDD